MKPATLALVRKLCKKKNKKPSGSTVYPNLLIKSFNPQDHSEMLQKNASLEGESELEKTD